MKKHKGAVLVTGVCGMIGSHLLDALLDAGYSVTGVDDLSYGRLEHIRRRSRDKRFRFVRADIRDLGRLRRLGGRPDCVIHEAALKKPSESQPSVPTLEVNGLGTLRVLEFARSVGAKVVLGSTSDVYGRRSRVPFSEEDESVIGAPSAKRWSYAVSKMFAEQLALGFWKDHGLPVTVLRYFGVFSERSSSGWSGGHVPMFIDAILRGRPVTVHGDGSQTRSMGHIEDVVRGTLLAMERPAAIGEVINLGNDEEISVLDSAKIIHREAGMKGPLKVRFVPMKKVFGSYEEIPRRVPDLRKARRLLGYRPRIRFREAVRRVIAARRGEGPA